MRGSTQIFCAIKTALRQPCPDIGLLAHNQVGHHLTIHASEGEYRV